MIPKAVEFMGGFLTGMWEKRDELLAEAATIPQKILDALGDVGSFLWDAGAQIIQGFWNGLKSKWDEVTGWVEGIGDWIADHKGPKAYDLALLVPNGEWIMQGLQAGIEAGVPQLQRTLEGVTGSMQAAVSATYSVPATQQARPAAPVAGGWSEVTEAIGGLRGDMGHLGIYLDGNALVGGISARMDRALVM
jgi:phage-related protein